MDHKQKDWPEWLVTAEFVVNNKIHPVIKVFLFMANYGRELRIGTDIKRKEKLKGVTEFAERMKKVQEKARAVLQKAQEEIKKQADRRRKKVKEWKKGDKIVLNIKDLVFKEQLAKKLVDQYTGPYIIDEVVFTNVIKL